jgi:hypothetical protein
MNTKNIYLTCKINNLHKKIKEDYPNINFKNGGIIDKNINILHISHTGLGNNLFEICNTLSLAWKYNLNYDFPDLKLLFQKIPEYPKSFYRNFLNFKINEKPVIIKEKELSNLKNNENINFYSINIVYYYTNFHLYYKRLVKLFEIDDISRKIILNKYSIILNNFITISIHIRRNDFVTISKIWNHNYLLKNSYFDNAINLIKKKIINKNYKFLIFSDDILWCKKNFIGNEYIFIENNLDYIDLWLMTLCNHNIISNSTFSWWGAYLNTTSSKIVIAPNKSLFREKKNFKKLNRYLYPPEWIIIKE